MLLKSHGGSHRNKFFMDPEASDLHTLQAKATCKQLGSKFEDTVILGLHGDGVPFTKHSSLEMISWNCLACPHGERVPFTGLSKQFANVDAKANAHGTVCSKSSAGV